jgi:hypothetical protein
VTGLTARPLDYPKPVRNYDAVEFSIGKRLASHWFGSFSYTWSRLYGNYAGPASSDELLTPTTGLSYATAQEPGGNIAHPARNANYSWDLDEFCSTRKEIWIRGLLATDRTHVFKLNGGYDFDFRKWGATNIGTFVYLGSGNTAFNGGEYVESHSGFVNGRGDMGRTVSNQRRFAGGAYHPANRDSETANRAEHSQCVEPEDGAASLTA